VTHEASQATSNALPMSLWPVLQTHDSGMLVIRDILVVPDRAILNICRHHKRHFV
jgi:hypothetical protein